MQWCFCDKFCQVSLKLQYTEKDVKISFSTTDHGMNFIPAISRLKLSKQTRNDIIVNDKGGYGTTPVGEFVTISRLAAIITAPFRSFHVFCHRTIHYMHIHKLYVSLNMILSSSFLYLALFLPIVFYF